MHAEQKAELNTIFHQHRQALSLLQRIARVSTPFGHNFGAPRPTPRSDEVQAMIRACEDIRYNLAAALLTHLRKVENHEDSLDLIGEVRKRAVTTAESGISYLAIDTTIIVQLPMTFNARQRGLVIRDFQTIGETYGYDYSMIVDFSGLGQIPQALLTPLMQQKHTLAMKGKTVSLIWIGRDAADLYIRNQMVRSFELKFFAGHYFSKNIVENWKESKREGSAVPAPL